MVMSLGARAIVLAEGSFGSAGGKTANGLVRHSRRYQIVAVIDSTKAGGDAGELLDGTPNGIPVVDGLEKALALRPQVLIIGVATFGGYIPPEFRPVIKAAIEHGLDIVAGLHEYLSDDPEFVALASARDVRLVDVRKPRPLRELLQFSDQARHLPCLRLPVLGTDGAIGKRTTAILLTEGLNRAGMTATFVATGQTGILQGAEYGVPIDAIKGDFMVGELEGEIVRAYEETRAQVIVVEGQGSISIPRMSAARARSAWRRCPSSSSSNTRPRERCDDSAPRPCTGLCPGWRTRSACSRLFRRARSSQSR